MAIELRELRALDNWFVDLIELEGGRALILQPGVDQTYLVCIEGEESNPFWKLCFKHEWDAGALVKMNVPSIVQLDRQHLFLAAGPHRAIIDLSKGEILKHIKADRWPSGEAHRQQNSVLVPEGDRLGQYLSGDLLPTSQEVPNGHWILGQHPLRYSRIVVEDPDGLKEPWLWRPSDDEMLDLPSLVSATADKSDRWIPVHSPVMLREDILLHPESCCEKVSLRALLTTRSQNPLVNIL